MNTGSTRPEATWVTRRCSSRESTSTTMSHRVSSSARSRPSAGPRPSASQTPAIRLPDSDHPRPDPGHPLSGPQPSPGLPRPDPALALECRPHVRTACGGESSPDVAARRAPALFSLGREICRQFISNHGIRPIPRV